MQLKLKVVSYIERFLQEEGVENESCQTSVRTLVVRCSIRENRAKFKY